MDDYLKTYVDKYDGWQRGGDFTVSSRIIPVRESLDARPWILASGQAMEVLGQARSFALADCVCRAHYGRCDKPRDVCLLLDELSDRAVERNRARRLSLGEAAGVLKKADESGLVHMTLYQPGQRIYALCSCCACCCHDLQLFLQYNRRDLVARSDYYAVTDSSLCTGCGACVVRCVFRARAMRDGVLLYDEGACLGCGLCVSACPARANAMKLRPGLGPG
jgi:ferredoxin